MEKPIPYVRVPQFMRNDGIKSPLTTVLHFSISELLTLTSVLLPLAFVLIKRTIHKMQRRNNAPFPFMKLPPELRDMVYENLLEDPHYPPPPPSPKNRQRSWLPSLPQLGSTEGNTRHQSNLLFLANKQVYSEYIDLMCKKTTFHLTIAPHNYTPPVTPAEESKIIWQISPQVLKHMKRCEIKLVTTSSNMGVKDPRTMKPEEWALARQMRRQLSHVGSIAEINLKVNAMNDHLWNPTWIWYNASEALRMMGSEGDNATGSTPPGPKINRITFSLDLMKPGENYLMRDPANNKQWAWWCPEGHCTQHVGAELTVRQFASSLFDCPTCHPEEDEDEDE